MCDLINGYYIYIYYMALYILYIISLAKYEGLKKSKIRSPKSRKNQKTFNNFIR